MKTYKFVGSAEDIDTLNELGFKDNVIDTNRPVAIDYEGYFDGCKAFKKEKVCVCVNDFPNCERLTVYRYEGKPNNHKQVGVVEEPLPFIKELIDAGLVKVIEKKEGK